MKTVTVDLGNRSYPIYIGGDLLSHTDLFCNNIAGKQVMVITNETIAPLFLERLMGNLTGFRAESMIIPDGESYKSLETVNSIITRLLEERFSRNSTLIALGGGVVGDITGFAAASYQRGIPFIQVPTTLLAQVDSSVGGKTGVNHRLGKNMIGAFHQPHAVIADTEVLNSLNDRELSAGLAEVIKYGLIRDSVFFDWLEANMELILERDTEALTHVIACSCLNKAEVVSEDEKESGVRALLNLGHTFGHAIETGLNYRDWLHGEAVACGMIMAAELSSRMGLLEGVDVERIRALLCRAHLPVKYPDSLKPGQLLDSMAIDKKARDGVINLVLLRGIGDAFVTNQLDNDALRSVLSNYSEPTEVV
ncbi:MAG: 3-dehydroquinate synthase [Gammaproteobacteria bacterium]|jgi:3-dehydroquinate synthase